MYLSKHQNTASPSGWYELLRFGRNLGRGPAASDKDPLPANAEHWRKICTPAGEKWANLNAKGTFKFSDADFPSFLGWQCFSDDENTTDQRCDSPTLRSLLAVSIDDMAEREKALKKTLAGRDMLAKQLKSAKLKDKLPRLICKYPSEFDQGELEARYGHVKEEDEFKNNQKNWDQFQAHIKALTRTDLPKEYKEEAQWHVHPVMFIQLMKKCGWLGTNEMYQLFPPSAMRPVGAICVSENITITKERVSAYRFALNKACRKYCVTTPQRMATFYANAMQETMWFNSLRENNSSARYYPWDGRGFLQLTWPNNYVKYFRFVGKTVSAADAAALQIAQQTSDQQHSNTALVNATANVARTLRDWRDEIGDGSNLDASANSAVAYWAWSSAAQQADALSANVRATKTVNGHQMAYYTNASMGNVAATVNVGHPSTNYASVNGIVARFQAYVACQMVLLDSPNFPDAQGTMKPSPENYTQRRP